MKLILLLNLYKINFDYQSVHIKIKLTIINYIVYFNNEDNYLYVIHLFNYIYKKKSFTGVQFC